MDKQVRSTSLYHFRHFGIVVKPRGDGTDNTGCFMTHLQLQPKIAKTIVPVWAVACGLSFFSLVHPVRAYMVVCCSACAESTDLRRRQLERRRRLQHYTISREPALPHPVRRRGRISSAGAEAGCGRPTGRDDGVRTTVPCHAVRQTRHAPHHIPHRESRRVV